jgi:hypothetical protein
LVRFEIEMTPVIHAFYRLRRWQPGEPLEGYDHVRAIFA